MTSNEAMTPRTDNFGPLRATHGKSRSFLLVGWFMAALFAATGLLVLWLTLPRPGVRFSGDISLLYAVGGGALVLGAATAFLVWRLAASQPTLRLYENGVRAAGPAGEQTTLYRDIADLYVFLQGGIGYRSGPGAPWVFTGARIHQYAKLTEALIGRQVTHRGALLLAQLEAGHSVTFRYFDDAVAQSKSFVASRKLDFPTHELQLSASTLTIAGKTIDIARLGDITTSYWREQSRILDRDGQVFHTIHPSAILSFDLLYALVLHLQRQRTPSTSRAP